MGDLFMKIARLELVGMLVAAFLCATTQYTWSQSKGASSAPQSATAQDTSSSKAQASLDFEAFKSRVEPIFLKKRPDHVRCYFCHARERNVGGGRGS